jgi:glycosyltransferase involved in cell wall biosynthesis
MGMPRGRLDEYWRLRGAVKRIGPDGVILWTSSRLGLMVSACQRVGCKVAVYVGNPFRLSIANKLAAFLYAALPRARAATLVAASRHVERSYSGQPLLRRYLSRVVYNSIALEKFPFEPADFPESGVRVGMVARLDPIKDHRTLLQAWRIVNRKEPSWTLELVGDGALRSELEQMAVDLGISRKVLFHGWVEDVPSLMREWSMVVHSTTDDEGLGNSMIEAMALGRPLVATNTGPVPEVTDDGRVAHMCRAGDPEDLARGIMEAEEECRRRSPRIEAARRWVEEQFSPELMTRGYMQCLGVEMPTRMHGT